MRYEVIAGLVLKNIEVDVKDKGNDDLEEVDGEAEDSTNPGVTLKPANSRSYFLLI